MTLSQHLQANCEVFPGTSAMWRKGSLRTSEAVSSQPLLWRWGRGWGGICNLLYNPHPQMPGCPLPALPGLTEARSVGRTPITTSCISLQQGPAHQGAQGPSVLPLGKGHLPIQPANLNTELELSIPSLSPVSCSSVSRGGSQNSKLHWLKKRPETTRVSKS